MEAINKCFRKILKKKKKTIKEENANLITQNTWSIYDHYLEKQLKRDTASTDRNS